MYQEASGAMGEDVHGEERSHRPTNGGGTDARVSSVELRVEAIEQHIGILPALAAAVGQHHPGHDPTGIYKLINDLGQRLLWWEKLRERAIGAIWAGVPILTISGGALWWFAGKQIAKAFGAG